jgi:gas vesicle structural protein
VQADDSQGLPELMESMTSGGAEGKTRGALSGIKDALSGDDDDDDKEKSGSRRRSSSSSGSRSRKSS